MATGSGKTLCMFVPVLAVSDGIGVIAGLQLFIYLTFEAYVNVVDVIP